MPDYHETRLAQDPKRAIVWRTLWESWFSRMIGEADTVVDLGCGYGDFINQVGAATRIAVDSWAGAAAHLAPGVRFLNASVTDLSGIPDRSVDFAFASNVFEHLERPDFLKCLAELRRVLKPTGTINILQPNYRFCYDEYFDDFTHVAIYSDRSLVDLLQVQGFRVLDCRPRFLPLTVKSRLPVWPILIRTYLALPVKPMGKQMFIRAGLADPAGP